MPTEHATTAIAPSGALAIWDLLDEAQANIDQAKALIGPRPVTQVVGHSVPTPDLSHMKAYSAIVVWLGLLPGKRCASPKEIGEGLTACGVKTPPNLQQEINTLYHKGVIRHKGHGQYGAL